MYQGQGPRKSIKDVCSPYLEGDTQVSVQGTTALPSGNQNTIKKTEWTSALMMYMSNSLGVNCTDCHQTRAMGVWEQSTPQRVTAWHGIRMVRDLNGTYLNPLKTLYPPERLGPTGDAPKVACETCHKGAFKPLPGASLLGDYPELAGYRTERPGVAVQAATEAMALEIVEAVPPEAAPGDAEPVAKPALDAEPEVASVSEPEVALPSPADPLRRCGRARRTCYRRGHPDQSRRRGASVPERQRHPAVVRTAAFTRAW
jgi:hypothetical protein